MPFPEKLTKLHTTLIDATNGYEEAARDAAEPRIAEFFRDMVGFHKRNADQIRALANDLDVKLDDSGSVLSTVHRTVVWIRSTLVRLDASELKPYIMGEEQIVSEYDDALSESEAQPRLHTLLIGQKTGFLEKIDEMKAMQNMAEER